MDKLILSYQDACIYESDYAILKAHNSWLNDRIISFYFEFLQREVFENESDRILFIGPEVTQAIKLIDNPQEANAIFLSPLQPERRSHIIFAVNDNSSTEAGGSHWSLCVFSKEENRFYHYDSSSGSNNSSCKNLVRILKACLNCESADMVNSTCLQQNNSYDCGIFLLCHTDLVCRTIIKSGSLESIKKLDPRNVQVKRNDLIQIVDNLKVKS